ncbi:MAG: nitroreductase family protein [Tenuifilaceae bacterium]|jgi:nitroreductase|nr:nitroreductase family protein [Bacteroidales bacterium]MDI9517243.1 nitroreductase family protein [Bacteroidota bacterium]NLH56450.1 nitroreductase [Rikenellaceae bacterium]OQC62462.1 MAG: Albonoursin synthase [Bacteroidetes bacterium ADurb.Bin008]HNV82333.1 nitroreductase family protein [Tenuifilaceae bacterium]
MKDFLSLVESRYSCRSFQNKPIETALLEKVLEAARLAPSAVNAQPLKFIVVTQSPLKEKIVECYYRPWISTAPVLIIACGDHSQSWRRSDGKDHCDIDVAIAIDHITLAAADSGLATCWVCKFNAMQCAGVLKLPAHISPVAIIPIGYPADNPNDSERHSKRKPLNEIVSWNGFG